MKGTTHAAAGMAVAVGGAWAVTQLWGDAGRAAFALDRAATPVSVRMLGEIDQHLPPVSSLLLLLLVGWIGGQFPDLDLEHTTIAHSGRYAGRMATGLLGRRGIGGILRLLLLPIFWLIDGSTQITSHLCSTFLGGHRGGLHSLIAGLVCGVGASGIAVALGGHWAWGVVFCAAFVSHLALDSLNPTGIMWGWPFDSRYHHFVGKGRRIMSDDALVNVLLQLALLAGIAGGLWQLAIWR